jgi:hypothetical protein
MLEFSEELGSIVTKHEDRERNPKKTVIDGVYVPALRHLLDEYVVPKESKELKSTAQCLLACGGYVEAAYIGYPKGFWWAVLVSSIAGLAGQLVAANIPVNAGGSVHDSGFVISGGKMRYGFIACDHGKAEPAWLSGAASSAKQLESQYNTRRMALIVREMKGTPPDVLPGTKFPVIVGTETSEVTRGYAGAMLD